MLSLFNGAKSTDVANFAQKLSIKLRTKHGINLKTSSVLNAISEVNGFSNWHVMKSKDENPNQPKTDLFQNLFLCESKIIEDFFFSLMPSSPTDALWNGRARTMLSILLKILCYLRDVRGDDLDMSQIRRSMTLDRLIELALDDDIDKAILSPLRQYLFELPGYTEEDAIMGRVRPKVYEQHGFLIMQVTELFSDMENEPEGIYWSDGKGEKMEGLYNLFLVTPKGVTMAEYEGMISEVIEAKINKPSGVISFMFDLEKMGAKGKKALAVFTSIESPLYKYARTRRQ